MIRLSGIRYRIVYWLLRTVAASLLTTCCLSSALCQKSGKAPEYTEMVRAVERNDAALVKKLVSEGGAVNRRPVTDPKGWAGDQTPLMIAAEHGNLTILKLLLAHGAAIEERATGGYFTALYYAVEKGRKSCVAALLAHGADPDTANIDSEPALLIAAERYPDIATMLIAKGANVNGQDITAGTALMRAVSAGHPKLVRLLLDKGADVQQKDEGDDTALTLARKQHNKEILRLIEAAAAKPVQPKHK